MYGEDASGPSEAVIGTAIPDLLDSQLAKGRGTHDAGLNGHIQFRLFENRDWESLEDGADGDEFGMTSAIHRPVCVVNALADDDAVADEDATDWCLIRNQGSICEI